MSKTTVIYHSADFDGIFCLEIARKFLPDAELIGWDFGDAPLPIPQTGLVYVMDLPADRPFGIRDMPMSPLRERIIWIDHHKSSIETHPSDIPGYRIDGVAACRLAWFYFNALERYKQQTTTADFTWFQGHYPWATKQDFVDRKLEEPIAVRLAGEYDVFDKRDPNAELFQQGLRSEIINFDRLLNTITTDDASDYVEELLTQGRCLQFSRANEYREVITQQGFDLHFEGLTFLACNSHELDIRSQLFEAGIKPHHDALLGFTFHGKGYRVSMYRIPGKDADILSIAKKYGGGGHAGACGLQSSILQPFDSFQGKLYFTP